jgi:predicted hotdog family 3-hydroxylacyl-ACP dehydratase
MVLIEEIVEIGQLHAVTAAVAEQGWPLAAAHGVDPLILPELAAQTAGIFNSYQFKKTHGPDADNRGWLVGIKQADFSIPLIPLQSRIISRAENTFEYDQLREITSSHYIDDRLIGRVTLQLMQA